MGYKNVNAKNNHKAAGAGGFDKVWAANATGNKGHALPIGPESGIQDTGSWDLESGFWVPEIKEAASVCSQQNAKVQSINGSEKRVRDPLPALRLWGRVMSALAYV